MPSAQPRPEHCREADYQEGNTCHLRRRLAGSAPLSACAGGLGNHPGLAGDLDGAGVTHVLVVGSSTVSAMETSTTVGTDAIVVVVSSVASLAVVTVAMAVAVAAVTVAVTVASQLVNRPRHHSPLQH